MVSMATCCIVIRMVPECRLSDESRRDIAMSAASIVMKFVVSSRIDSYANLMQVLFRSTSTLLCKSQISILIN